MTMPTLDPDTILQAIATWPIEEQIKLARAVLERAAASTKRHPVQSPEQSTWEALYGIASNGQEPPTDEQVAQWLDEHRMEKSGNTADFAHSPIPAVEPQTLAARLTPS